MFSEFKKFIMRGNVMDMAVGIIIGAAFGSIVKSLVGDVIMPMISPLLGKTDFSNWFTVLQPGDPAGPYTTLQAAREAGATTANWGVLVNEVIAFLVVAFAVFVMIRTVNGMVKKEEEKKAAAPPKPSAEVELLGEIRDLLSRS